MNAVIGTTNKGKIDGAKQALNGFFDDVQVLGLKVESGVPNEPVNKDILVGAKNRAKNAMNSAKNSGIKADFFMGIESGITNLLGNWQIVNVAYCIDKNGYESFGTSAGFPVPKKYVDEIIKTELGSVMDHIFETNDLRSNVGGISYLTHGKLSRIDLTREAFIMALTQYVNGTIWKD